MNRISELKNILSQNFKWNKSRIDCFAKMLLSLFSVRTVNLSEIAVSFASNTAVESRYKRLQRFFRYFKIDYDMLAKWVFSLFVNKEKFYIVVDRTNWFWGKVKINILTLGIAYEGIAIPLMWKLLNKAGNATANEHKEIIKRFVDLFGTKCIAGVLGDREFASGALFEWLNKENIPFFIRIKDGSIVKIRGKKFRSAKKMFNNLERKQRSQFGMAVELWGAKVYLCGSRSERGELMIVATNQRSKSAVEIYLRRWEIETLFSCLKSRGFYFEATHLKHIDRIEKMMGLLTVGLCWAHKIGEWRSEKKQIRWCKHREFLHVQMRPQNSYFRLGLDLLREVLINPYKKKAKMLRYFNLLIPPKIVAGLNSGAIS
jgi:hypothetical protein